MKILKDFVTFVADKTDAVRAQCSYLAGNPIPLMARELEKVGGTAAAKQLQDDIGIGFAPGNDMKPLKGRQLDPQAMADFLWGNMPISPIADEIVEDVRRQRPIQWHQKFTYEELFGADPLPPVFGQAAEGNRNYGIYGVAPSRPGVLADLRLGPPGPCFAEDSPENLSSPEASFFDGEEDV